MQLDLTTDEARILRAVLHDHLPELRREVARAEERTLRHELAQREDLCERVISLLETAQV